MASYNKIILMGNLTRDPQLSYLPSQTPVVEIGLAVNHRYRDNQGNQQEKVCFIDCRSYGKQAEVINQYLRKGRSLLVEGRLELDMWEDQQGNKRSKHRVFIERFSFVDSQQSGAQGGGERPQSSGGYNQAPQQGGYAPRSGGGAPRNAAPPPPQGPADTYDSYDEPPAGDDIPF